MPPRTYALLDCNALNYLVRPARGMALKPAAAVSVVRRGLRRLR
jgi:hypothetical protein